MDERLLRILGGDDKRYPRGLEEKYPRILSKIMTLWDKPEVNDYFMDLMVPARQDRAGFPPEIATEIVHLSLVHASSHPPDKTHDIWAVATDKFAIFKPQVSIHDAGSWKPLSVEVAKTIERMGCQCSAKGFHQAAETGNHMVVSEFLKANVNTELTNERGWTPLMLAAFNGHDDVIAALLKYLANIHAQDLLGHTALHWAADAGRISTTKTLVESLAAVDARNKAGFTPLYVATAHRHLGVVLLLIDNGANLNLAAVDGSTALHKAAASGFTEIVRTLMFHGANCNAIDRNGDTPQLIAQKYNHPTVVKILMSATRQSAGHNHN
ncbi:MAG: ankyrin repeat domain-containing protein [Gallionella sp.]